LSSNAARKSSVAHHHIIRTRKRRANLYRNDSAISRDESLQAPGTRYQESGYCAPQTFARAGTADQANLLWMFLSGNQDMVLQSDEEDSAQVVEVAASAPVEIAAIAPLVAEASAPGEVAARAQEAVEATRKRKP
jgi:hypothetical protein